MFVFSAPVHFATKGSGLFLQGISLGVRRFLDNEYGVCIESLPVVHGIPTLLSIRCADRTQVPVGLEVEPTGAACGASGHLLP